MRMVSPLDRWYSNSCCCCCHVRTGTIILGIWYMLINGVVLLILLSALSDPERYHLPRAELGSDFDFTDDANICIATAISLLMITICGMATYGAYKGLNDQLCISSCSCVIFLDFPMAPKAKRQRSAWIVPFFCYQIFDLALNTLVAISVVIYPNSIQDYLRQLPANIPYKEDIMSMNRTCLVLVVLIFIGIILAFKPVGFGTPGETRQLKQGEDCWIQEAYLIACVWNCYRYINGRPSADVLVYVTNDTAVLLPPYEEAVMMPTKDPPPPYMSA